MGITGPYLSPVHLKGFDKYKYNAIDTSPLSNYIIQPFWNQVVKLVPKTVAPNVLTFTGWIFLMVNFAILAYYDWDFNTTSNDVGIVRPHIPSSLWFIFGVLHFTAHTLDGIDGKQARRTSSSSPLGELFDHGLDSLAAILIPICLISAFGRGTQWGGTVYDAYFPSLAVMAGFLLTHWEKYITGVLFLPWLYDIVQLGCGIGYFITSFYGVEFWNFYMFPGWKCSIVLKYALILGFLGSIPVSLWNIYNHYKKDSKSLKRLSFMKAMEPWSPFCLMSILFTVWVYKSPTEIMEREPRVFIFTIGVFFSNIAWRLIIAQMSNQRCEAFNKLLIPLSIAVTVSQYLPQYEVIVLYVLAAVVNLSQIHFAVSVVQELCHHFNIYCFSLEKKQRQ